MTINLLLQAILDNNIPVIQKILQEQPELLSERSEIDTAPLELAQKAGHIGIFILLIRSGAQPQNPINFSKLLGDYFSEISSWFCASWLDDIECIFWEALISGNTNIIYDHYDPSREVLSQEALKLSLKNLKFLSEQCQGWVCRRNESDLIEFIPRHEWDLKFQKTWV